MRPGGDPDVGKADASPAPRRGRLADRPKAPAGPLGPATELLPADQLGPAAQLEPAAQLAASPPLRHRRLHGLARHTINPIVTGLGLAGARHSPIGLVIHVGRRSGRIHRTPLAVHRRGRELLVPLTYGPGARWCLNVLAAGSCRVRLDGRDLVARCPQVVGADAMPAHLAAFYRLVGIRDFLELTLADDR